MTIAKPSVLNDRRPPFYPKKTLDYVSVFIVTFFGSGLLPKAPGTWGTLASIPLFWLLTDQSLTIKVAVLLFILVIGTLASAQAQIMTRCGDHQSIVIDEVLGTGITLALTGADWRWFLVGAILFRFFDIVKPPPVNWVDTWSKSKGKNPYYGGFGVMADDLVAGLQALLVLTLIQKLI